MRKIYVLMLCALVSQQLSAQTKSKYSNLKFNKSNKEKDLFLKKQWWLGIKGGPNLSKPVIEKRYTAVSPTNYNANEAEKKYDSYKQWGSQVTLEVTFYFRGFSASLQPTYRHIGFDYTNHYEWQSALETTRYFEM